VNRVIPNLPSGSARSLSSDWILRSKCKRQRDHCDLKIENGGPILSASKKSRPSQHEDIFRAYAKIKAPEAADEAQKNNSSTKNE
jgi:hypothetical protein